MDQAKLLRTFHNDVKMIMISKYSSYVKEASTISLLDIGVGRGGDMHKWNKCNIRNVIGIDVNKVYIHEAIKRLKRISYMNSNKCYKFYYTFPDLMFQSFCAKMQIKCHNNFDLVSCMFAFHYFWKNEHTLRDIIKQISDSLKDGGYFIGVAPQGEAIQSLLGGSKTYTTPNMQIERKYDTVSKIGDAISFMLSGTLYFGENMMSDEYLIFKDVFVSIALEHDLHCVEYTGFKDYYMNNYCMNDTTKEASFVNCAFAFVKKTR